MDKNRWRVRGGLLIFQLCLDAGFGVFEPFLVRMQPPLIRVLEGCGQRRHDLATVAEIAADLCPLLILTNSLEAASDLDSLLQLVEVQRPLVNAGKAVEMGTVLLVELCELVQVMEICAIACTHEHGVASDSNAGGAYLLPPC